MKHILFRHFPGTNGREERSDLVLAKYGTWTYTALAVCNSLLNACKKRNAVQCIYRKLEWNTGTMIAIWMLFQCGCWCWSVRKWRCTQRSCSVCKGNTEHGWYHYCSKKSGENLSSLFHCFNRNKVIAVKSVLWWR